MIRDYRPDDSAALYAIYIAAARASQPHYTTAQGLAWAHSDEMEAWWPDRMSGGRTWVSEDSSGHPLGFITLTGDHLDMFFVHPDVRGQGVGRALYDRLMSDAREQGLPHLTTFASLFLHPILTAKGWVTDERQEVERGGETLVRYAMHVDLQDSQER